MKRCFSDGRKKQMESWWGKEMPTWDFIKLSRWQSEVLELNTEKFLSLYAPWLSLQTKYYIRQLICRLLFIHSLLGEIKYRNFQRSWISFTVPFTRAFETSIERSLASDIESLCLEGTTKGHLVWLLCSEQGHPQLDQSPVEPHLEHDQGWSRNHLSGQPLQSSTTLIVKKRVNESCIWIALDM